MSRKDRRRKAKQARHAKPTKIQRETALSVKTIIGLAILSVAFFLFMVSAR
jgi:hypothetical protein